MESNIFLSYCWKDEDIVEQIDNNFKSKQIIFQRDKRKIKSWESIKGFMKKIRKSDYAILVISDNYLKSTNCMYEVLEVMKDEGYKDRIITVVLNNVCIYDNLGKAKYIKHWNEEYNKLFKEISGINDKESCTSLSEELKKVGDIMRNIGEFISIVSDMNNPHINDIFGEISKKLHDKGLYIKLKGIEELKKKFTNHYDEKITPPSKDVKYIIDELVTYGEPKYIRSFLLFAYKSNNLKGRNINDIKEKSFWEYIINSKDEVLRREFIAFLIENLEAVLNFILMQPSLLKYFCKEDELTWKLINEHDLGCLLRFNYNHENIWALIIDLLKLDILKPEENLNKKNEIFKVLADTYGREEITASANQIKILIESGFIDFLEDYTISSNHFAYPDGITYANDKYCLIKFYLENAKNINKNIIKAIKKIYEKVYFGRFSSMMAQLVDNNKNIKAMIYQENL